MNMPDQILSKEQLKQFSDNGYLILSDFLSEREVDSLKSACHKIVEQMDPSQHTKTVFTTTDPIQARGEYFLNSGDKICFFFEEEALDEDGNLKVDKYLSLNKIGHALHWLVPEFKSISFSPKVKALAENLGYISPAVVQSMYIFKQPRFGGEVMPHKDCTFLSTVPQSCKGLWFALEDATLENGCLWFSPGSHRVPTKRRFMRNPEKKEPLTLFNLPADMDEPSKYVPAPVKKGSLVLIDGEVDHKSKKNTSAVSRHIYTFHIIERHNTTWDPLNWLQPTSEMPFTGLYENVVE